MKIFNYSVFIVLFVFSLSYNLNAQNSCIGGGSIIVEPVCIEMLTSGEFGNEEITVLTTITDNTGATLVNQDCAQEDGNLGSGGSSSMLGPGFTTMNIPIPYTPGGNYGDNNDFPNTIDICFDVWEDDSSPRCTENGGDDDLCSNCTTVDIASIWGTGGSCPEALPADGSVNACTANAPNVFTVNCNGDWNITYQVYLDLAPPVELSCPGFLSPNDAPITLNANEMGTGNLLSGGTWSIVNGGGSIVDNGNGSATFDPAGTTPGTSVQVVYSGDNCCRTIETSCFIVIVECPSLDVVTMDGDGCIGDDVTLTATITPATAIENENYVIVWQEDGVDIPGSSSAGPDGVPGTADDISTMTYIHTLPGAGVDGCTPVEHTYTAQLYCITNFTLQEGDSNPGNASTDPADTVIPYNAAGQTCVDLDLSSLPACALAASFDYSTIVTSGPPFGASWICEALLEVQTPVGNSGPFCDPFYGGACPATGSGNSCFGGPTGAGTNTFSGSSSFGGLGSTTPAQGVWSACFSDSFNDTGGTEGVVNYILLDIQALLPPGCSINGAGSSMDAANTGSPVNNMSAITVCTPPVLGTDFSEPAAGCDNFAVTDLCGDLSIGYSSSAAGPFDHSLMDGSSFVTPADGEMIFYEIYVDADGDGMSDCAACAITTGSFTLTDCCPTATLSTTPTDICNNGTTQVCYTFDSDAEGVSMIVNGVSATCSGCGTGPLCVTLTDDNTSCDPEMTTTLVTMLCADGSTNVMTVNDINLNGSATATAGDFNVYPAQPTAVVDNNTGDVCSSDTDVVSVNLVTADGASVCDNKTFDAPANTTCAASQETITYDWTVAEIETITTAPSALSCYAAVSGTADFNVYPIQPTVNVSNLNDVCDGTTGIVTLEIQSADGATCDTRTYDANANNGCSVVAQSVTDTYSTANLETLFTAPAGLGCYADLSLNETVNVYPAQLAVVLDNNTGDVCSSDAGVVSVNLVAADGASICDNKTFDAPANTTCVASQETIIYDWTIAEIETITAAPSALSCYTQVSGTADFNVYPIQPTVNVTNLNDVCGGTTGIVTLEVQSANGATCDTRTYDANVNNGCSVVAQSVTDTYSTANIETLFTAPAGVGCYADLSLNETVNVYPAQLAVVLDNNTGDVCSSDAGVVSVNLVAADGSSICDNKTFDAPANTTCAASQETITYDWTVAEIETITTAPSALSCYATVSGTADFNVYPIQPTVNVTNLNDVCDGTTGIVTLEVQSANGTTCDTRTYDANVNNGCSVVAQSVTDTYSTANIETLFTAPAGVGCYADLSLNETANVYPAQLAVVLDNNTGDVCSSDAGVISVNLVAADGSSICDNKTFDAPANMTCAASQETITYDWTVAEIETITTAPSALSCYATVSGMADFNVYPIQPTVNVTNLNDVCDGTTGIVILEVQSANGTTCDTRTYDANANNGCSVLAQSVIDTYSIANLETLFTAPAGVGCYTDLSLNETVNVYPAQLAVVLDNNTGDVCSSDAGVVSVNLVAADGSSICDNKTFDAPANMTCAASQETITYNWTVAEIETITTAPSALSCYAPVSGTADFNVYPIQPTVNVTNLNDVCDGTTGIVTLEVQSADGATCDTRTYNANANNGCSVVTQNVTDTYSIANLETLFTAPAGLGCYTDLSLNETVNVYPAQLIVVLDNNTGDVCSSDAGVVSVNLVAADGSSICDNKTFDAPANTTCTVSQETITYDWTVAEIETITSAPSALSCYATVSGTADFNVYPIQPIVNVTNLNDVCDGTIGIMTLEVRSADGATCDTRTYNANVNNGCSVVAQNVTDTYSSADIETLFTAPSGIGCYIDLALNETVNVYPDANNFAVEEAEGECDIPAMVSITAVNGDLCFAMSGFTPEDPGCDNPDDIQDMTYNFDPGFIAACNATFGNTVPASCATTFASSDPAFDCPPSMINFCSDNLIIDLNPIDNNGIAGATGVFSGSGTIYLTGNQAPSQGAQIDLSNAPVGVTFVLEYTVTAPGCASVTTSTNSCSFSTFINCNANGGSFPSGQ